jgi:ATP-binding cassette subfamily C protein LapB
LTALSTQNNTSNHSGDQQNAPLIDAFLYALELSGLPYAKSSFVHGIPENDIVKTAGLIRAAQGLGADVVFKNCTAVTLAEASFPAILFLDQKGAKHNGASDDELLVVVIESFAKENNCFNVKYFAQQDAQLGGQPNVGEQVSADYLSERLRGDVIFISDHGARPEGKADRAKPSFSRWLYVELKKLRSVYQDVLLAAVFINLFALASPLFVMNVYDRVVPNQAIETLWVLASGLGLVLIFDLTIKLLRHHFIEMAGKHLDIVLSSRLFAKVLNIRLEAFPESVGAFASQLKDFDAIKQFFTAASLAALIDLPFSMFFLVVIYYVGGMVAVAPLIAALFMICYGYVAHFSLKSVIERMQSVSAEKNATLVETLSGVETVKSMNAQGRQQKFWEQSLARLALIAMKAKRMTDSISIVSGFIIQTSVAAVVIIGVYQIDKQLMSMGGLIACVLLSGRALAPMAQLANLISQYYQAKSALTALDDLVDKPGEFTADKNYLCSDRPFNSVEARNITFGYTPGQQVLKSVSIKLNAGEKVAIIGKIGSGKSSLMRLLLGFGQPSTGQLLLNGLDLSHLNLSEVRDGIAYVPQEIILFRGSLRENILLKSPRASQKELLEVVEIAGLSAFVQNHPLGLDMPIGEQGKGLSGGQKQSVAIARSLLNNPHVLLFDELTSSMDNQSEQLIITNIKRFAKEKTMVLSTHRASLLALVDRVIVMDDGRIIADGEKNKVLDALKRGLIKSGSQEQYDDE